MFEAEDSQEISRHFPKGTVMDAIAAAYKAADGRSVSGGVIMDRVDREIRAYVPDLPSHMVTLAWKVAIIRDKMYTIDGSHLEGVIYGFLQDSRLVDNLNNPEVTRDLSTEEGMRSFTEAMQAVASSPERFGRSRLIV